MLTDRELLQRYVQDASEEAFAEIVRRHIDLVYGAALRQLCGNRALAEDVTQAVFTSLSAKADALLKIKHLAAWLYGTTRFTASHAVRTERRRQDREQKAQSMHAQLAESGPHDLPAVPPKLFDEVLEKLDGKDREAILLRFFEGQSFLAIGSALETSEDAARMRVTRALEKVRTLFARNGIKSSAAAVAAALASQAVAAPAHLAMSVSATALTGAAALIMPAGAKLGIIALMTTTKTTALIAGVSVIFSLAYSVYQHRETAIHAREAAQLIQDRHKLEETLRQSEQRSTASDYRAAQAEQKNAELQGKLDRALAAAATQESKSSSAPSVVARATAAERMAQMKPLLEAGMPIKGAFIVLVDGKATQRPVAFVINKETRIESTDDGTYIVTPRLNQDGTVKYEIALVKEGVADGLKTRMEKRTNVIQTPWEGFTMRGVGNVFAFDPDKSGP